MAEAALLVGVVFLGVIGVIFAVSPGTRNVKAKFGLKESSIEASAEPEETAKSLESQPTLEGKIESKPSGKV